MSKYCLQRQATGEWYKGQTHKLHSTILTTNPVEIKKYKRLGDAERAATLLNQSQEQYGFIVREI